MKDIAVMKDIAALIDVAPTVQPEAANCVTTCNREAT
jgi:hypothetical protein